MCICPTDSHASLAVGLASRRATNSPPHTTPHDPILEGISLQNIPQCSMKALSCSFFAGIYSPRMRGLLDPTACCRHRLQSRSLVVACPRVPDFQEETTPAAGSARTAILQYGDAGGPAAWRSYSPRQLPARASPDLCTKSCSASFYGTAALRQRRESPLSRSLCIKPRPKNNPESLDWSDGCNPEYIAVETLLAINGNTDQVLQPQAHAMQAMRC